MMTKQEVIEEIKKQSVQAYDDFAIMRDTAIYIVNQLNEPERPVVPQFVADWYEDNKDDFEYNVYDLCVKFHEYELNREIKNWFDSADNKPIETLVMMHKFGYEVKKEKLYTVELPNPNRADVSLVLGLYNDGKVAIFAVFTDSWKYEKQYKLTEAEIKKDF
ncbi:MAG: DUF1642 domain-containing protein [Streptococcus lutetiensis]